MQIQTGRIRSALKSRIAQNTFALYGTQCAAYVFPLLTIPYLARVLGPVSWGQVALAQAVGLYLSTVIEFGFQLSATRQIARYRGDRSRVEEIVAGVLGAKTLLAIGCAVIFLSVQFAVPQLHEHRLLFGLGAFSGVGQGFSLLWYYQGEERMKVSSAIDVIGKGVATAGILLFVRNPADSWKVLGLQCISYCGASICMAVIAYREVRFKVPTFALTLDALKQSASMFLFRSAVTLYTTANTLILGAMASPSSVAYYSGAERISKAGLSAVSPLSQSFFPRISHLITNNCKEAARFARISAILMSLCGLLMGGVVYLLAPLLIHVILGSNYDQAIPVLRVLSLLLPAIALSNVLGVQWMLPLGFDGSFNGIIISAGVLNVGLALWWAHRWSHVGMAWAVAVSEIAVTALMYGFLVKNKLDPFSNPDVLADRISSDEKLAAKLLVK